MKNFLFCTAVAIAVVVLLATLCVASALPHGFEPMGLRQTVPPAVEPVTLPELKDQLNLGESDDHNTHLNRLNVIARRHVEAQTWRQLINATWQLSLDAFPTRCEDDDGFIYVPRPRLQSVTSILYIDGNGTLQTWDSSKYQVDARGEPGRIAPAFGQTWPTTRRVFNAVTITFVAGYGTTPATVPEDLRHAINILVAFMFDHRTEDLSKAPPAVAALLKPFVISDTRILESV